MSSDSRWLRRAGLGALAMFATATLVTACASDSTSSEDSGSGDDRTLVVGIGGDPANLDPQAGSVAVDNEISMNTYLQWLQYALPEVTGDEIGVTDVSQVVGEGVEIETSEDGLVSTFTIREGLVFPSGNTVTSEDFRYTIDRSLTEAMGSAFIFQTAGVTDVSQFEEISDSEFTLTVAEPSPLMLPLFRDQSISVLDSVELEKHATADDPWAKDWLSQNSLGGGAYSLASYEPGNQIVLERNNEYPGADDIYFEKVILQIVPAEDQRAQLLANGTLDIAQGLSVDSAESLVGTDGVRIEGIPTRAQDLMGFVQTFEPFKDVRVRQAVAAAVDYEGLAEFVGKGYADQPLGMWPQNSFYFDADLTNNPLVTDLDQARALLAEAGYADGFTFDIAVSTAEAGAQAQAVAVQSALAEIGVTVTITQLAPAAFSEQIAADSGQAFIRTASSYVDDPYYSMFLFYTTDAVLNWWAMDNADINAVADQMRTEIDPEKRMALASQAQELLNAEVPHLVLSEPYYIFAAADDIQGFVQSPDGLIRYSTLTRAE
ncbi:ABC transporter substrate-binding protein [Agromyces aerolatus]|uniref:ABC transporter substrate-binding protein n=1 Tax=Agromyces sp. LY-1074 TaxID=3074080 RepID=UPI00285E48AF|nr:MULTISPECIES: ABC transporter substrate-binding protein [unclassified Agromyces]MDR5700523.1 ABC transporter substrate-binding protein [Agromyces sp. LY-1074]MDR5707044.1 ABC transporter substrate-binding protein [Agromyces sp. LY-1358]